LPGPRRWTIISPDDQPDSIDRKWRLDGPEGPAERRAQIDAPENERRVATLRAVLMQSKAAATRHPTTSTFRRSSRTSSSSASRSRDIHSAGKSDLAKAEREEIDVLRHSCARRTAASLPRRQKAENDANGSQAANRDAAPLFSATSDHRRCRSGCAGNRRHSLFFVFSSGRRQRDARERPNPGITLRADDRTMGNPKAKVTFLEYAAPTCPHCAHFAETVMPQIKQNYIDTGKVFYIFRTYPLSATDGAVEAIARCLPADKYFQFIDLMFRNQSKWDPDGNQIADVHAALVQMARIASLSPERVDQCISNKDEQDRINTVALDGSRKYNIDHTPTFVVNGEVVDPPIGGDRGLF